MIGQDVVVVCEHEGGQWKSYSLELIAKAAGLATAAGGSVHAVAVGSSTKAQAARLGAYGAARATVIAAPALAQHYNSDGYTTVLTAFLKQAAPAVVLGSATPLGKDCLPRVAMRLQTGLVPDCVALDWKDGRLVARHPIYAGKALVDIVVRGTPQMALARPNAFGLGVAGSAQAEVAELSLDPGALRAVVTEVKKTEQTEVDLTEATIIVSGGRALGSAENFRIIRECAQALGGSVGASRAAVDAGYMPHDHQVGQTGKTVNPTLYIACGISGAIQHLAGMRTSRYIVAINKDPDAPIFSKADFGIVGDLFQIVPLLTQKLKQVKSA